MIFNEILIPQDSFTKTNVTRKRVCRRKFVLMENINFIFVNITLFRRHLGLNFNLPLILYDSK